MNGIKYPPPAFLCSRKAQPKRKIGFSTLILVETYSSLELVVPLFRMFVKSGSKSSAAHVFEGASHQVSACCTNLVFSQHVNNTRRIKTWKAKDL